jgi:hypothetical protein
VATTAVTYAVRRPLRRPPRRDAPSSSAMVAT